MKLKKNDGTVTFRELSEGEQQLLTVLGLLQFTSAEESLFLLDEPDTHLNARWSVEYLNHIRNFLKDESDNNQSSHVLLATHNPIAVAELVKEQVQILKRDNTSHEISAIAPDTHPRGMGYAGVVTSEMFGLNAALDTYTQDLLQKKRRLSAMKTLSPEEEIELKQLTNELESYGFRYEVRDPFLRAELIKGADRGAPELKPTTHSNKETDMQKADRLIRKALGEDSTGQTDA